MNKNDLRVIKTKEIFHKSLVKLLTTISLDKIKVSQICREANVSRGTFYLHYEIVQDVFDEYYQAVIGDLKKAYEAPLEKAIDVNGRILDSTKIRIFHHVKQYEEFYKITFSKKIPMSYYYMIFDEIGNLLRSISMSYKRDLDIDVDYYIAYQTNAIMGLLLEWHRRDFSDSAEYITQQLYKIVSWR